MKIIDAHIHTNFSDKTNLAFTKTHGIDFSWKGLQNELAINQIEKAIAITTTIKSPTPGEADILLDQAQKDFRLKIVCSIHPDFVGKEHLKAVEQLFKQNKIIGIKIFPGYHPVYPDDQRYFPFYELAGKYNKPVIIHTGDTFGSHYRVKYAHPLPIDDIAVQFRKTTFVIAHLGNPWIRDATELVYKNENVYADISAFCIGCVDKTPKYIIDDVSYALEASGRPDKFLYGSDWPLVSMKEYIKIIMKAVPKKYHKQIFFENAKRMFNI